MGGFTLKVKFKSGQEIVNSLLPEDSIKNLKDKLSQITNIKSQDIQVLRGFPPKVIDLSNDEATLQESNITSGETLIVQQKKFTDEKKPESALNHTHVSETIDSANNSGILLKMVVPSDDSCLFTSIGFVLNGKVDPTCAHLMREIIANAVAADPENYCEAVLGRTNQDYCDWIKKSTSWGGAIELSILSQFYGLEIAVVDSSNGIINRFGEDQHYGQRVFLMFDGIHYDPLYLDPICDDKIQTMFPTENEAILLQAANIAKEAKSSHQYTDLNKFTLKCINCGEKLTGSESAQEHAKNTGHLNFGEIMK